MDPEEDKKSCTRDLLKIPDEKIQKQCPSLRNGQSNNSKQNNTYSITKKSQAETTQESNPLSLLPLGTRETSACAKKSSDGGIWKKQST